MATGSQGFEVDFKLEKMNTPRTVFKLAWIGVCALTMLVQTRLLLDFSAVPGWLDGFVLGGAMFAYNFTHPDRRLRAGAWMSGLFGGVCLLFSLPMTHWQMAALIPVVLWLLYYGLQRPGTAGLRGIPAAKPVVVALAWAWVTVLLPLPREHWDEAAFIFLGRAAFIFTLALGYDLVDMAYDRQHGLTTLAGKLGFDKTFLLINSALAVAAACCCANYFLKIYGSETAAALLASLAFSAWWLRFLFQKTIWHGWEKVLVDGLMVLQFVLVGFGKVVGLIA